MFGIRAVPLGLILFYLTLCRAENKIDWPDYRSKIPDSRSPSQNEEAEKGTLTFTNVVSPETLLTVLNYPWHMKIVIKGSHFSHLPLLPTPLTHNIKSFVLDSSFLVFLAPQTDEVENHQPFLKALDINYLEINGCPCVHAFDWENANTDTLHIRSSQFVSIPKSLKKMTRLTQLIVVGTGLKWVPRDTFHGMDKIKHIQFSNNPLQTLEPGTFSSLESLRTLDLSGNIIMSIAPGVLPGRLSLLVLHKNPLHLLDFNVFEGIEIDTLYFCERPLNCTCGGLGKVNTITGKCVEDGKLQPLSKKLFQCKNPNEEFHGDEENDGCS